MASTISGGTQTATVSTEHTLCTSTAPGTYLLQVNTKNLGNGDVVKLRVKVKVLAGDATESLLLVSTFAHAQADTVKVSIPVVSLHSIVCTLEQVAGVGRAFDWALVAL